jgi:hypothetical protein
MIMAVRFVVLLIASLALALSASAQCEICQVNAGEPWWGDGTCQPSPGATMCSYWCCLMPGQGAWCSGRDRYFGCSDGVAEIPSMYFASKLPLVTEGSTLRVRLGPAKPVARRCSAAIPPRRSV